jgi:SAM-dependent methyltransferase
MPRCRLCAAPLEHVVADLGMSPLANSYIAPDAINSMEPTYPLRVLVCAQCWLVQVEEYETPEEIFTDYAYFSSYSTSWLAHSERYANAMVQRLGLDSDSLVVELASNDGYLLQYFDARGVPVLGVEPAANVARVAIQQRIPTLVEFFGEDLARALVAESAADLLVANNVVAHVPDLNDFVSGMEVLLKPGGTLTVEVQHLLELMTRHQFDTIYHEHFSYYSLCSAQRVFAAHDLRVFDVEQLPTHGGSLRLFACRASDPRPDSDAVADLLARERAAGLEDVATYTAWDAQVRAEKRQILTTLFALKEQGLKIAGYGAPAKGNTMLNYCGIGTDVVDFTVDRNPAKQGTLLPGSRIPVLAPEAISEQRPDVVLILPWNLRDEVIEQLAGIREWGGRFVVRNPALEIVE